MEAFINAPSIFFELNIEGGNGSRKIVNRDGTYTETTESKTLMTFNEDRSTNNFLCDCLAFGLNDGSGANSGGIALFHMNGFIFKVKAAFFPWENYSEADFFESPDGPGVPDYNAGASTNSHPSDWNTNSGVKATLGTNETEGDLSKDYTYNWISYHLYGYCRASAFQWLGDSFVYVRFKPVAKIPGLIHTYITKNLISNPNHITADYGKYTSRTFDYVSTFSGNSSGMSIEIACTCTNLNDYSAIYIY